MRIHRHAVPIPENMRGLPMHESGYLKPWFVKEEDFRVMDEEKAYRAMSEGLCWICGKKTHKVVSFVTGWRSADHRLATEPPCHPGCADYAMQVCPFILLPKAKRREAGLPVDQLEHVDGFVAEHPHIYYVTNVEKFTPGISAGESCTPSGRSGTSVVRFRGTRARRSPRRERWRSSRSTSLTK